jgi:hypothetical protein
MLRPLTSTRLLLLAQFVFGCASSAPDTPPGASGAGTTAAGASGSSSAVMGGSAALGGSAGASSAGNGNASGAAGAAAGGAAGGGVGSGGSAAAAGAPNDFCAPRSGLTFCETFEEQASGPALAQPPWTPSINGDGQVTIDDSVAHSGQRSLKVHGSGFSTFLVLSGELLPSSSGRLHVRSYVRIAEPMSGGHNTFLVADTQAAPGAGNAFRLGEMNAMLMYTVMGDTHGALANDNFYTDQLPGAALTPMAWGCLEVALDHQKPEIQVWLDGVEIPDLHHTDWALDAYDALRFGFEKYAGPVRDIWYDDIALGTARLGCE